MIIGSLGGLMGGQDKDFLFQINRAKNGFTVLAQEKGKALALHPFYGAMGGEAPETWKDQPPSEEFRPNEQNTYIFATAEEMVVWLAARLTPVTADEPAEPDAE